MECGVGSEERGGSGARSGVRVCVCSRVRCAGGRATQMSYTFSQSSYTESPRGGMALPSTHDARGGETARPTTGKTLKNKMLDEACW